MSTDTPENEIEPDEDLESDDSGNEQDDEGTEGEKPYKPPTKGEWDRLQRRIAKLTKPAADVDKKMREQIAGKAEGQDEGPSEDSSRWRDMAIQASAAAQISAAGFSGTAKQAARLARLIDTQGLEPDGHGAFDLEDEIADLRDEYPQLFSTPGEKRNPRVRTAPSGDRTPVKDPTAVTSARMLKQAGYN